MKRNVLIAIVGLVTIVAIAVAFLLPRQSEAPIRVGVLVPLTGGAASYGQNAKEGVELALQYFARRNPKVKIELSIEDSRGEAAFGVRAAQKLIDVDHVAAVI